MFNPGGTGGNGDGNEDHELGGEFWRKSSFCENAECVEVAAQRGGEEADREGTRVTFVRDSKNKSPHFPRLAFTATAFADLVRAVS